MYATILFTVENPPSCLDFLILELRCGAIARAKLERNDLQPVPLISYEAFVQSLDHGDSFTTTLVDILVKVRKVLYSCFIVYELIQELAERQKRPSSSDRHLLAERTATSLKTLSRSCIYRPSPIQRNPPDFYVSRSSDNTLSDWGGVRVDPWGDEIDEEIDPPTPLSPSDPTVFQPFADPSAPMILRRSFPVQTVDVSTDEETQQPTGYPSRRSPPSIPHYNLSRHPSLTRESAIRRPTRSRTNDFSEFTTRRRALGRSDQNTELDGPDRSSVANTSRSVSSETNPSENIHNATTGPDNGAEIDGALPVPPANGNTVFRRNDILRLRSSGDPEYALESLRSNFNLYGSSSNSAAPSSSRLTVHMPHLRRPRIRRSNQTTSATLPSGDGYTHTVRIGSPPANNSSEIQSTRLPLLRSASPLDVEYVHRLSPPSFRGRSPLYSADFTPPRFPDSNETTAGGGRDNREPASTINLPTPRSISPEAGSSSQ